MIDIENDVRWIFSIEAISFLISHRPDVLQQTQSIPHSIHIIVKVGHRSYTFCDILGKTI